jgi:hypothetical protein
MKSFIKNTGRIFSALCLAALSQAALAQKINIVDSIDANLCSLIAQESCSSAKSEGVKVCTEKHKEAARKLNANSIVLGTINTSKHRKPSLTGGIKSVTITEVPASYYACDVKEKKSSNATTSGNTASIEARLNTLNSLKEKALISEAEYSKKRQEILNDL